MPNPDGSPTLAELMAANPNMPPGGAAAAPGPNIISASLPADRAGTPSLQDQLAAFGAGPGGVPPPAPPPAPPTYATKLSPNQQAALSLPSGLQSQLAAAGASPAMPSQPPHVGMAGGSPNAAAPAGGGTIRYQPAAGGSSAAGGERPSPFMMGAAGVGGGPAYKPNEAELAALEKSREGNNLVRDMQESDSAFQRDMAGRDVAAIDAETKAHQSRVTFDNKREQSAIDKYDSLLKDYPQEKIDTDRFWKEKGTGGRIGLAIAAAFAGFANPGAPNQILQHVEGAVQQDIDAQKHDIATRQKSADRSLEGARTAYEMIRGSVHDSEAAEQLTHAFTLEKMAAEGKQRALLSQDVQTRQNWQATEDALTMRAAQLKDAAAARIAAARGAGALNMKEFRDRTQHFIDEGYKPAEAETLAMRLMGQTNQGAGIGAKPGKEGGPEERQYKVNAINEAIDRASKNPAIEQGGLLERGANALHLPNSIAPDTAKLNAQLDSINMQTAAPVMGAFKDNEGRVPPPVVEQLHKTDIEIGDPPDVRRAKIEARRNIVNTMAEFLPGVKAPQRATLQSNLATGFKPAGS